MKRLCQCGHVKTVHLRRYGFESDRYDGDLYLECLKCGGCWEYTPVTNLQYLETLYRKKVNKIKK